MPRVPFVLALLAVGLMYLLGLGAGQRRPAVEVDAEHVEPGGRQRERGGGAESRGRPQHEGPAGETDRSGGVGHAAGGILS